MAKNLYHHQHFRKVLQKFKTDPEFGLSRQEAAKRQKKHGPNEIVKDQPKNIVFSLLWHQINSLLVYILIVSALISYWLGHAVDAYIILAVIIANAAIGFTQEFKANKAIEALKKIVVSTAKVYREKELLEIPSRELVPGDLVLLEEGDRVSADGRLIEARSLRTIESSLTGEAFPVEKNTRSLSGKTPLADRKNFVWMSTFVAGGTAKFVVTAIGPQTAIGKIAQSLTEIKREKTHFEMKTDLLAKQMSLIALSGAAITFFIGFFLRGLSFAEIFTFTVASLVSGIPEGLPAVLTIILATGASRMARKKAIIRSLPATETLSVVDVIATDKTGTLTQNAMTVKQISLINQTFRVNGSGWKPEGKFYQEKKEINPRQNQILKKLIFAGGLCSRAKLINKGSGQAPEYSISGDPTEGALTVLLHKAGLNSKIKNIKIIEELPFNQEEKYKAVLALQEGKRRIFASGAPETILKLAKKKIKGKTISRFSEKEKREISDEVKKTSRQAMRVIALAYKKTVPQKGGFSHRAVNNLIFLGFVGIIDPPRPGVREAVLKAQKAGIRVIMKTGDHRETALAIAKETGIISQKSSLALSGEELEELSSGEFEKAIEKVNVFARLTPDLKYKILSRLQKRGHRVAMTGDGVNDVLALKKANIGIAMGSMGTDVARESSDIVLADDNFASLIDAVEEGRIVFTNTRQASAFLVTTNLAEDIIIVLSMVLGLPLPLLASQILWMNLVTDGVVDVALAAEPGHGDLLDRPPLKKEENILSAKMISFLLPLVLTMVLISLAVFIAFLPQGIAKARTAAFCIMCFTQLMNIFNMRSLDKSLFKIGVLSNKFLTAAVLFSLFLQFLVMNNPFLMRAFRFVYLSGKEVIIIFLLSSLVLVVGEAYKYLAPKKLWHKNG